MAEQQQSKPALGSVMPPPKEFGREMNPDDSAPFENSVPTTNDPNVPPPFIPNGSSCAACQRNLAVKVSGTRYVSRVNNDSVMPGRYALIEYDRPVAVIDNINNFTYEEGSKAYDIIPVKDGVINIAEGVDCIFICVVDAKNSLY